MIEVAVGCLVQDGKVLIGQRLARQSHAGQWEFPGGKLEAGETAEQALVREFAEETGLLTSNWRPLIQYPWDHGDIQVRLHVFITEQAQGELQALEGHAFKWCRIADLAQQGMLVANFGIIHALQLPQQYLITGDFRDIPDAIQRLKAALNDGIKLIQLRAKHLEQDAFIKLAQLALPLCHGHGAKLILNAKPEVLEQVPQADGLQLASSMLFSLTHRPISKDKWLAVSVHNEVEIAKALELEADFILLSPVKETNSHPGVTGLGWERFAELVKEIPVPVFALGGLSDKHRPDAIAQGAQGVAAISGYWPKPF
jgi:8-oxo-dGTP diphosphatase